MIKNIVKRICNKSSLSVLLSVMFVLNTVLFVFCVEFFVYIKTQDFYKDGGKTFYNTVTDKLIKDSSLEALDYCKYLLFGSDISDKKTSELLSEYKEKFSEENSNFFFKFTSLNSSNILSNYQSESRKDYYPDSLEFFKNSDDAVIFQNAHTLSFEGHIKKELTADDEYMRTEKFFGFINSVKYIVVVLIILFSVLEFALIYFLVMCAGYKNGTDVLSESSIDKIPGYFLAIFYIPIFAVGMYFFNEKFSGITDIANLGNNATIRSDIYTVLLILTSLSYCMKILLETVSVRIKTPNSTRHSLFSRIISMQKNVQSVVGYIIASFVCEIAVFVFATIINTRSTRITAIVAEILITLFLCYIIFFTQRNVSSIVEGTNRLAVNKKGKLPDRDFSGSYSEFVRNINFLSKSASVETEKRFINESFSTKLINGISSNIKKPLSQVLFSVALLESDTLTSYERDECIRDINTLSTELKKTIEDIILISKATTGNIEISAEYTDIRVLLSQIIGEYYEMFASKDMGIAEEKPDSPVLITADGKYMWYVLDNILSLILELGVPGTRVFMTVKRIGNKAILMFRSSMKPEKYEDSDLLMSEGNLKLPIAKVFSELQGGELRFSCKKDTFTAVLRFPLSRFGSVKKVNEPQ